MASPDPIPDLTPADRLATEVSLLQAMYPATLTYNPHSREVHYTSTSTSTTTTASTTGGTGTANNQSTLTLRLPDTYPTKGVPEIIAARDGSKQRDIRDPVKRGVSHIYDHNDKLNGGNNADDGTSSVGEGEVLDQIIEVFEGILASTTTAPETDAASGPSTGIGTGTKAGHDPNINPDDTACRPKTVIIWLHHLLALSKRKLAITPTITTTTNTSTKTKTKTKTKPVSAAVAEASSGAGSISGLTKPGYPGIMIFSGPRTLVDAHIRELKALNWQAFQVRYDSDEDGNGNGKHVSSMSKCGSTSTSTSTSTSASTSASASASASTTATTSTIWRFTHGQGKIVEVETMADVVKGFVDDENKNVFLRAVGVK